MIQLKCDLCDADAVCKVNEQALCVDHVKDAGAWDTVRQIKKLHKGLLEEKNDTER